MNDDLRATALPLYARVLGPAWSALPPEIRRLHDVRGAARFEGVCSVRRGTTPFARLIAALFGFPRTGDNVDVSVRFDVARGVERWTRTFAGRSFSSRQFARPSATEPQVDEQFGPLRFTLALVPEGPRLTLLLRRWSAFGIPMPRWLGPWQNSFETVEDGRFRFDVEIGHRLAGPIVHYRGWLRPASMMAPLRPGASK